MGTQGKEFFFHTGGAEMSSSHVAGLIQDDTDLTPLLITIDHAPETLQYRSEAMDLNRNAYRFERTQLDVRFAGVDYEYARARFPKRPAAFPTTKLLLNEEFTAGADRLDVISPVRICTGRKGAIVS
jgi:hypothetical protein